MEEQTDIPLDLEKDPKKFLQFQADEAYGQLAVIQRHFEWIIVGKDALFCLKCSFKHFQTLSKTCQECIGGKCPAQPVWQELSKWAEEKKDMVLELIKGKKLPTLAESTDIAEHSRKYRQEMEKILVGEILPESEAQGQKHVR